jgi:hypothetical protein
MWTFKESQWYRNYSEVSASNDIDAFVFLKYYVVDLLIGLLISNTKRPSVLTPTTAKLPSFDKYNVYGIE